MWLRVLNFWFISGLPHRLMADDVYKDMHIPKGSLIFANIWYVLFAFDFLSLARHVLCLFIIIWCMPISYSIPTGRCRAMKHYIRMLMLSVLNGSWYQLRLRWNARWTQRIMCLDMAEGEFLVFGLISLCFEIVVRIYMRVQCQITLLNVVIRIIDLFPSFFDLYLGHFYSLLSYQRMSGSTSRWILRLAPHRIDACHIGYLQSSWRAWQHYWTSCKL